MKQVIDAEFKIVGQPRREPVMAPGWPLGLLLLLLAIGVPTLLLLHRAGDWPFG